MREHPRLHTELHRARQHSRDHLTPEHRARRDLHVMSQLEVRRKRQRLRHCNVPPRFEHHHRDGTTGQHVPDDQLCDNVETNLLVCDGLDHANWNDIDEG